MPLDTSDVVAEEAVEILRSVTIFAPLELAALERLALALVPVECNAGDTLVAEGGHGDRYYVIRQGTFEVTVAGEPMRQLGPGEGFGEIALLRDVPRTATVAALTQGRLYTLDREHFLDAVQGSPSSAAAADTLIDMRLGSLRAGLAIV